MYISKMHVSPVNLCLQKYEHAYILKTGMGRYLYVSNTYVQHTYRKYMEIYIYIHVCVCIYMYVFVCLFVYVYTLCI